MFYSFGIFLYGLGIRVASLFSSKARKWCAGRKGFWQNLPHLPEKEVIWFHCASLGEYDQGKPIMEAWKKKNPSAFLLITFFSPSGYEHIKDKSIGDYTCYLPLDTPRNAKRFIDWAQPKVTIFIKYEIWVNHLKAAKKAGSKLYLVSAVFRGTQHFFKWWGWNSRKGLQLFDHIFVQYAFNLSLLYSISIENVSVSGDTRYDRVLERAQQKNKNSIIANWAMDNPVFVIGSSWPKDEEMIIPFLNNGEIEGKAILAPHEVNKEHIQWIKNQLTCSFQCYTSIQQGEPLKATTSVVILDCIGVLADAYRYGNMAYVGGAFGTGLHNILEPAAFGLPVIFGSLHQKFLEAQEFIDQGIGKSVGSAPYFLKAYSTFRENKAITEKVHEFMASKKGATNTVMDYLDKEIK